jgi:hypothetical protein
MCKVRNCVLAHFSVRVYIRVFAHLRVFAITLVLQDLGLRKSKLNLVAPLGHHKPNVSAFDISIYKGNELKS